MLDALALTESSRTIKIGRLRLLDDEIMLFVETYLPHELCSGLGDLDLSSVSLYDLLRERYGLTVATGRRTIEAVAAQAPLTRLLKVEKGAPLLKIESTSYLADGRPLEYYEAWHRGNRSKFEIEVVSARSG